MKDVLSFAEKEGLFVGNAYKDLIFNEGKSSVSYLLQVAEPFKLEWVTWSYPVLGTVPYQGFFEKEERDKEALEWIKKSYDTHKGRASAFSALGWFADPLYSSMLKLEEAYLAETLFHELVHRTFWLKNDVLSNEQLATFLAQNMTRSYLKEKSLKKELDSYELYLKDQKTFFLWLSRLKKDLREYYESLEERKSFEEKNKGKQKIYKKYLEEKKPSFLSYDFIGNRKSWNNAGVLSQNLYQPDVDYFKEVYVCSHKNLVGDFLEELKDTKSTKFEAKAKELCSSFHKAEK